MILYDIIRRNSVLITHGSEMGSYHGFQGGCRGISRGQQSIKEGNIKLTANLLSMCRGS